MAPTQYLVLLNNKCSLIITDCILCFLFSTEYRNEINDTTTELSMLYVMSLLVSIIMIPPLGLKVTTVKLQDGVTVFSYHVSLEITLLCSFIITLSTETDILYTLMFRSVMCHHIIS